ncbi:MAG: pyridoxine 5'-phosphate synthase [Xanthomonadaceae bacterium]|nr:pyridoxine 5'-phosphate synthase [Xanthomonadaceae bacterium]
MNSPRLGVNIDHFATLRQLRGTPYPDLLECAKIVENAGAALITVHLREDRRHIQDADVVMLKKNLKIPLNLEMSLSEPMVKNAIKVKPAWACLVPEKRQEVTTEGGLNIFKLMKRTAQVIGRLNKSRIKVSAFIEPDVKQVEAAHALGCEAIEIHTGAYANETQLLKPNSTKIQKQFDRIIKASQRAAELGLGRHIGHGLDYSNVAALASREWDSYSREPLFQEYNIGHSIVCRAAIVGLDQAVREMISEITAP